MSFSKKIAMLEKKHKAAQNVALKLYGSVKKYAKIGNTKAEVAAMKKIAIGGYIPTVSFFGTVSFSGTKFDAMEKKINDEKAKEITEFVFDETGRKGLISMKLRVRKINLQFGPQPPSIIRSALNNKKIGYKVSTIKTNRSQMGLDFIGKRVFIRDSEYRLVNAV